MPGRRSAANTFGASVTLVALLLAPATAAADGSPASSAAPSTSADPSTGSREEAARARFRRGLELSEEGAYKLALIEFTRAYELAPSYRLLYDIGQVQMQLGQYAAAMRTFKQYLDEGGAQVPADRRAQVEQRLASLRPKTATLTVRVSEPDATIELDQESLGRSPLAAQTVDAGEHRVRVSHAGYLPQEQTVTLAGGDISEISVSLVPLTAPTVEHPVPARVWIAWTSTGALAVGAGVFGGLALKQNSDLSTLRATAGSSQSDRQAAANRANTFAIATDGLVGGAVIAAALATYFTIRGSSSNVRVGVGPGSVMLGGAF